MKLKKMMKIKFLSQNVKKLEIKVEELTKENNEFKIKIEELKKENIEINKIIDMLHNLYEENKIIKEEISKLKKNISLNLDEIDSNILKNKSEINFVLEEIKKKIGKKNNIKLIYRGTKQGDLSSEFNSKCDSESR